MAIDPYASCPCGSGKKFKWCCQPIHAQIEQAFSQEAQGQHELALRLMDELLATHPDNPEVYGRKAVLLYRNQRAEEAEASLDRAFALNPNYAFGFVLKATFRLEEGEIPGALVLFRKAVDHYDPQARDLIANALESVAQCELRLNHPVAAAAALRAAVACEPTNSQLVLFHDQLLGNESPFPMAVRKAYTFRSPAPTADGSRRQAWDKALAAPKGRFQEVRDIFLSLITSDPNDAAAWFNLSLAYAWLGDNPAALEALERFATLETDERAVAEAWALAEVLRCGAGMEPQSDHSQYVAFYPVREPAPLERWLQEALESTRLLPLKAAEGTDFVALLLDLGTRLVGAPIDSAPLAGQLVIRSGMLVLTCFSEAMLRQQRADLEFKAGAALGKSQTLTRPRPFEEIHSEGRLIIFGMKDQDAAVRRFQEYAQDYFESRWIQQPLKSLGGVPPIDAVGHAVLKRKLHGLVDFAEQCAQLSNLQIYDFGRLRRKLNLVEESSLPKGGIPEDITVLSPPELANLPLEKLSDSQLEQAFQTAQRLAAHELGERFARSLAERPPTPEQSDRFPAFAYLVTRALADGALDRALDLVNEGERIDCASNNGQRRNDYELRRGQVHVKRREVDAAYDVFERLLQRDPTLVKARVAAAEGMITLRQGAKALHFAEQGLVQARSNNDRDSEGHFLELASAARKMG